jgi:nicotinamide riboside kinase
LILEVIETNKYDLHLLCSPDIPWEADVLRENPHDRHRLFSLYEKELQHYGFPYIVLSGSEAERLETANEALSNFFSSSINQV